MNKVRDKPLYRWSVAGREFRLLSFDTIATAADRGPKRSTADEANSLLWQHAEGMKRFL